MKRLLFLGALLLGVSTVPQVPTLAQTVREAPLTLPPGWRPPRILIEARLEPIQMRSLEVQAEVSGPYAVTVYTYTFYNPNGRVLEGNLEFPLLEGQSVTGFALELGEGKTREWREAVPVEKPRAQQVFEDITRRNVDPAVVQQTRGNNYEVRVYPLPPQGERRVRVEVSERLLENAGSSTYRLPLVADDPLELSVSVSADSPTGVVKVKGEPASLNRVQTRRSGERVRATLEPTRYQGRASLELELAQKTTVQTTVQTVGGQTYFLTRIPKTGSNPAGAPPSSTTGARPSSTTGARPSSTTGAPPSSVPRKTPTRVQVLWDSSMSGLKRNLEREWALLDAYFKRFQNVQVELLRFRDVPEKPLAFNVQKGNWSALRSELERTVYDGGTDFAALECATCARFSERLLFSDGLDTLTHQRISLSSVPLYAVSSSIGSDSTRLKYLSGGDLLDLTRLDRGQAAEALLLGQLRLSNLGGEGVKNLAWSEDAGAYFVSGIRSSDPATLRYALGGQLRELPLEKAVDSTLVARQWARMTLDRLEGERDLNAAEIRRLGKAFGLVTPQTSLIVLDRVEDYVRFEISPPESLKAEYTRRRLEAQTQAVREKQNHLTQVLGLLERYETWWRKDFPKGTLPAPEKPKPPATEVGLNMDRALPSASPAPASPITAEGMGFADADSRARDTEENAGSGGERLSIQLKKWTPDAPYIARMQKARTEDLYRIYLDERPDYLESTAFFLDVADLLLERGQTALGLRVLSNLSELRLENRAVLRILGYRYLQAKKPLLAIPVLERVRELAPYEPQSHRDLGLAHAQAGQHQQALEALYEVVTRTWDGRFAEVELIALNELNALIHSSSQKLDTRALDPRLLRNLPVDLRVVLTWDADNTDMDLWVTDPNGQKVFYGAPLSYQGGRISRDMTGGYGPEEFTLKAAKKGTYTLELDYYGNTQQVLAGAVTVQAKLITRFGTRQQKEELITLRLKDKKENVLVGQFEVK